MVMELIGGFAVTVPSSRRRRFRDIGMERTLRLDGQLPSYTEPPPKERGKMRRLLWLLKELFWHVPV
jgi:hypothetical protein